MLTLTLYRSSDAPPEPSSLTGHTGLGTSWLCPPARLTLARPLLAVPLRLTTEHQVPRAGASCLPGHLCGCRATHPQPFRALALTPAALPACRHGALLSLQAHGPLRALPGRCCREPPATVHSSSGLHRRSAAHTQSHFRAHRRVLAAPAFARRQTLRSVSTLPRTSAWRWAWSHVSRSSSHGLRASMPLCSTRRT